MSDVLVVDDNPLNLEIYRRNLEGAGYHVQTAESGSGALELLDTPWPDLIVLDVHMPGMDGFDLCRRIRSRSELADIPVLFVSAKYQDDFSMGLGLELGASDYLVKPFNSTEFLARVAAVARQRQEEVELQERAASLEQVVGERDRALERSERRFRRVVEHAAEGICLVDRAGYIVEANPMAEQILGWDRKSLQTMRATDFLRRGDYRWLRHQALTALRDGRKVELTFTVIRKDGEQIPIEATASGMDGYLLVLGRDVREKQRLEEQLRRSDRLSAIGQLASGLVHEIRNPLAGLTTTLLYWQRKGMGGEELGKPLQQMLHELERVEQLLKDLLNYASPRPPKRRWISVRDVFQQLEGLILAQVTQGGVGLRVCVEDEELGLEVDPNQLQQVLLNLCINALNAMPDGGSLELKGSRRGDGVVLVVKDSGKGIAAADLPHIFEPFFTTQLTPGSSGLGLAVVQRIVHDHGGELAVHSDPPRGTEITLYFPPPTQKR